MGKAVKVYRLTSHNARTTKMGFIKHNKTGFAVYSNKGERLSRYYPTANEAAQRLHSLGLATNAVKKPTAAERDPTREAGNRRRAKSALTQRLKNAEREIVDIIESIPVRKIEIQPVSNKIRYEYDLDPQRLDQVFDQIAVIIQTWLQTQRITNRPARWFFTEFIEQAYTNGTSESAERIRALYESATGEEISQLQLERILTSEPFKRRIQLVYARVFEEMAGFAGQAAADLSRILANGMAQGVNARQIVADIRKEFVDIKGYRAMRIVRTEINKAHTDAKAEQTVDARDRLGIDLQVMHVSALVPNTRKAHAQRHGKLFTPEQQQAWWADGANRVNCLCTTIEVMFINGKMLQQDLIKKIRDRGDAYFVANPKKA